MSDELQEIDRLVLLLRILYNEFDNNEIAFHQIAMSASADQFVIKLATVGSNKAIEMQNMIDEAVERATALLNEKASE